MEEYTKLPNEIIEALSRINLSPYETRYLLALIRKTYGFHKKSDYISNSQFVKATGIKRWHISRTQKKLINRKIIRRRGKKICINENYGEWKLPNKVAQTGNTVAQTGNKLLPKQVNTKENIKKLYKRNIFLENTSSKEIENLITLYKEITNLKLGKALEISPTPAKRRIGFLLKRKEDAWSLGEIKDLFKWFVDSDKAQKYGHNITVALSDVTLNTFRQLKNKDNWRYEK